MNIKEDEKTEQQELEQQQFINLVQEQLDMLDEACDEIRRLGKLQQCEEFANEIINDTVGIIVKPTS